MSLRQAKLGPFLLNRHNHMGWQQIITFTTIEYRKDTLTKNSFLGWIILKFTIQSISSRWTKTLKDWVVACTDVIHLSKVPGTLDRCTLGN